MGQNATSYAFINPNGKVETFIRLDFPEGWSPPEGYRIVPDDELPEDLEMQLELHNMEEVRIERDQKLKDTDWTQTYDSPVNKEAWAIYRQSLRDLPENYNGVGPIPWPSIPE